MFNQIEYQARKREKALQRCTRVLNHLNEALFERRIGRRIELSIEQDPFLHTVGWGLVQDKWQLFVKTSKEGVKEMPLMESSLRTRLAILDKIPLLLEEITETLRADTAQITESLDRIEKELASL